MKTKKALEQAELILKLYEIRRETALRDVEGLCRRRIHA